MSGSCPTHQQESHDVEATEHGGHKPRGGFCLSSLSVIGRNVEKPEEVLLSVVYIPDSGPQKNKVCAAVYHVSRDALLQMVDNVKNELSSQGS